MNGKGETAASLQLFRRDENGQHGIKADCLKLKVSKYATGVTDQIT